MVPNRVLREYPDWDNGDWVRDGAGRGGVVRGGAGQVRLRWDEAQQVRVGRVGASLDGG